MTINHSNGFPNWSQLNNKAKPYSECNVTAAIDAAQCTGYDVMACRKSKDPTKRPPDDLYEFMHTDQEILSARDAIDPACEPNELMEVLAIGLRKWLGVGLGEVAWHPMLTISEIVSQVIGGACGILHGHYRTDSGYIDHMNALVGLVADGPRLVSFLLDDPYGDYRTKYATHMGNDVIMPASDVTAMVKPVGSVRMKDIILVKRKLA